MERAELLRASADRSIDLRIVDLFDRDGLPAGTRVEIDCQVGASREKEIGASHPHRGDTESHAAAAVRLN
jgi:hypothetical protein